MLSEEDCGFVAALVALITDIKMWGVVCVGCGMCEACVGSCGAHYRHKRCGVLLVKAYGIYANALPFPQLMQEVLTLPACFSLTFLLFFLGYGEAWHLKQDQAQQG